MSKQVSLSAHISTALMALFVFAVATGGANVEPPADHSGPAPLAGLSIGR